MPAKKSHGSTIRYAVLGGGLVGSVIARDLANDRDADVKVFDVSDENLARFARVPRITTKKADLSDQSVIRESIADADCVVGAIPGRYGYAMLRTVIESGKPLSDICFAPEDPLTLDGLAREKGVTAVVDCGVSPGLSNLAIGRAAARLDSIEDAVIYVGGLPAVRHWPFEYRSVFSPTDVIEEYTRPARMIVGGALVVKPALSDVEPMDFPGVGTLEAFNTDGLRTLISTVRASNMREKTMRYPGHAERMRMLRDVGFLGDDPVEIDGVKVVPRALAEKLLFHLWKRPADEPELTVLRIIVRGSRTSSIAQLTFDLIDRTDATGQTSMARTTGFPCAIMARMLAKHEYVDPGVRPPELFAANQAVYEQLLRELKKRDVDLVEQEQMV
jgi:saccharopine dehydrogenase-like NADP-dependent oxidoreductase